MPSAFKKPLPLTARFRLLEIGESITIECTDPTTPHGIAKVAGIKVATKRTKEQPAAGGYRIKCTRVEK
jgi:hypothetical protein